MEGGEQKKREGQTNKGQEGAEKGVLKKTDFPLKQVSIPIKGNYQRNEPPVKRLSDAKFRARLDKCLCFKCNERYSPGHKCKMKKKRELMLFIMNEEESVEEENQREENSEEVVELKQLDLTEETKIELRVVTRLTNRGMMKLKGEIRGKEVVVPIDSGATHNFLHIKIVEEQQITVEDGTPFGVTIGNGTKCREIGVCRKVEMKLKGLTVVTNFLAIDLGSVDVVLGMQWLGTIKTMKINWPSLIMKFWVGTRQLTLKGDPSLVRSECSFRTIEKTWEKEDQCFLLELQNYDTEMNEDMGENQEIKGDEEDTPMLRFLLQQYVDIFEDPKGLPPKREVDH